MKEIYRSFEEKLNPVCQFGIIIKENNSMYQIENVSVWTSTPAKFRVYKNDFDISILGRSIDQLCSYIGELYEQVNCGQISGQILCAKKWVSPIGIMKKNQDAKWRKYI